MDGHSLKMTYDSPRSSTALVWYIKPCGVSLSCEQCDKSNNKGEKK
jgi:hypothetical protein